MPRGWGYAETKQALSRTTPEPAERKLIPKQWLRIGTGGGLEKRTQNSLWGSKTTARLEKLKLSEHGKDLAGAWVEDRKPVRPLEFYLHSHPHSFLEGGPHCSALGAGKEVGRLL